MKLPIQISLKAARVNVGMTQKEAGKAIGVSQDVISNWERGITYPNVEQIQRIEKAYKISYDNLIFLPAKYGLTVQ